MKSKLCRIELMNTDGTWRLAHAGIALLDPERYVNNMAKRGTLGRVSILDDKLQPSKVYTIPGVELL